MDLSASESKDAGSSLPIDFPPLRYTRLAMSRQRLGSIQRACDFNQRMCFRPATSTPSLGLVSSNVESETLMAKFAVAPGPMDTPFFYPAEDEGSIAYHKSQSMNGDLTKIEDVAPIVRFLATDGWWITGQTIFANGGYTTR
jgi:hypothetical protein